MLGSQALSTAKSPSPRVPFRVHRVRRPSVFIWPISGSMAHRLAALIDWAVFEREWSGFFPSGKGWPATEPRLVAGLLYLQHADRLSDEAVGVRWVETLCCQHFTGEVVFQHQPPIDPPL